MAAPRPFPTPHPVCLPSGCPRFTSLYNKHLPSLPLNACQSTCGIQSLNSGIHVYDKFSGGWRYVLSPVKITKPSPSNRHPCSGRSHTPAQTGNPSDLTILCKSQSPILSLGLCFPFPPFLTNLPL